MSFWKKFFGGRDDTATMVVECPFCKQPVTADENVAGVTVACPNSTCARDFLIPAELFQKTAANADGNAPQMNNCASLPFSVKYEARDHASVMSAAELNTLVEKFWAAELWEKALPLAVAHVFKSPTVVGMIRVAICFEQVAEMGVLTGEFNAFNEFAIEWFDLAAANGKVDVDFYTLRGGAHLARAQVLARSELPASREEGARKVLSSLSLAEADLRKAYKLHRSDSNKRDLDKVKMARANIFGS